MDWTVIELNNAGWCYYSINYVMEMGKEAVMTKEDLWENWADPSGWCEYMERGYSLEQTEKDFYEDLEAWYDSRHVKELNAIKTELIKTLAEMDAAVGAAMVGEEEHRDVCNGKCDCDTEPLFWTG